MSNVLSLEDERCPRHPLIADGFRSGADWYKRELEKLGPLFAEQPAPVAVVMPDFESACGHLVETAKDSNGEYINSYAVLGAQIWETAILNGVKP